MTFATFVDRIVNLIQALVPLVFGFAILVFLYGLLGYMINIGDESKRRESIRFIVYGLIGLFVMISIWGLTSAVSGTFGFEFGIPRVR